MHEHIKFCLLFKHLWLTIIIINTLLSCNFLQCSVHGFTKYSMVTANIQSSLVYQDGYDLLCDEVHFVATRSIFASYCKTSSAIDLLLIHRKCNIHHTTRLESNMPRGLPKWFWELQKLSRILICNKVFKGLIIAFSIACTWQLWLNLRI